MKRMDFIINSISTVVGVVLVNCSVGLEEGKSASTQKTAAKSGFQSQPSRERVTGPSDIKSLSAILQRAGCPLNENQINYLLKLKEGPEFTKMMGEVLDDEQLEAVKNAGGGRRRGGRGR